MLNALKSNLIRLAKIALCVAPMLGVMYFLFWLTSNNIWTDMTPHRDLLTGLIVAAGLGSGFLLLSHFVLRSK